MAGGQACGPRSHKATQTGTGNWCHFGFDLLFHVNLVLTFRARGQGKVAAPDAAERLCEDCVFQAGQVPMKLATNNNKRRNCS